MNVIMHVKHPHVQSLFHLLCHLDEIIRPKLASQLKTNKYIVWHANLEGHMEDKPEDARVEVKVMICDDVQTVVCGRIGATNNSSFQVVKIYEFSIFRDHGKWCFQCGEVMPDNKHAVLRIVNSLKQKRF